MRLPEPDPSSLTLSLDLSLRLRLRLRLRLSLTLALAPTRPNPNPNQAMTDLRGRVDLREVELPTSPSAYPSVPTDFSLELGSTQRTFVFCARSATELQEWLCHLRAQIARARAASSPAAAAYAASLGLG